MGTGSSISGTSRPRGQLEAIDIADSSSISLRREINRPVQPSGLSHHVRGVGRQMSIKPRYSPPELFVIAIERKLTESDNPPRLHEDVSLPRCYTAPEAPGLDVVLMILIPPSSSLDCAGIYRPKSRQRTARGQTSAGTGVSGMRAYHAVGCRNRDTELRCHVVEEVLIANRVDRRAHHPRLPGAGNRVSRCLLGANETPCKSPADEVVHMERRRPDELLKSRPSSKRPEDKGPTGIQARVPAEKSPLRRSMEGRGSDFVGHPPNNGEDRRQSAAAPRRKEEVPVDRYGGQRDASEAMEKLARCYP